MSAFLVVLVTRLRTCYTFLRGYAKAAKKFSFKSSGGFASIGTKPAASISRK